MYTILLIDKDGFELARKNDIENLKDAKVHATWLATDLNYKSSDPFRAEVYQENSSEPLHVVPYES